MELGRKGVFWFTDTLDRAQLVELAERCEQPGLLRLVVSGGVEIRILLSR